MTKDEIELQYIIRKNQMIASNKNIGIIYILIKDVRFIGDLYIVGVIPEVAICIGIRAMVC